MPEPSSLSFCNDALRQLGSLAAACWAIPCHSLRSGMSYSKGFCRRRTCTLIHCIRSRITFRMMCLLQNPTQLVVFVCEEDRRFCERHSFCVTLLQQGRVVGDILHIRFCPLPVLPN